MPFESVATGPQICTRLAEPAIATRVKRNDPFADQISMEPKDIEEKHRISMLVAFHDADVDRMGSKPDATPLRTVFKDERSCKPGFYVHVPKFNLDTPPPKHSTPRSYFKKIHFGMLQKSISDCAITPTLSMSSCHSVVSSTPSSIFDCPHALSIKSTPSTSFQSTTSLIPTPPRPLSQMAEDPNLFLALDRFFYGLFSSATSSTDSLPASSASFHAIDMVTDAHHPKYESSSPYPISHRDDTLQRWNPLPF